MKKPLFIAIAALLFSASCAHDTQPPEVQKDKAASLYASAFIDDPQAAPMSASACFYDPKAPPVYASRFLCSK